MKIYRLQQFGELMITSAYVEGPKMGVSSKLLVDTGSTYTIISRKVIESVGISLTGITDMRRIVTGSREEWLPRVCLDRFDCLGQSLENFYVIAHTFPLQLERYIMGLLGMDFLKRFPLEIRTQSHEIVIR